MNKGELINKIVEDASITKGQATEALSAVLNAVTDTLKDGDKLSLVGFGTFSVNHRPERKGINPRTKEPITIKAKNVVKFKAGKELSESIN